MSQSVIIAGVLLFLFLVYVTAKGQLPSYLNILGINSTTSNSTAAGSKTSQPGPLNLSTAATAFSAADLMSNLANIPELAPISIG